MNITYFRNLSITGLLTFGLLLSGCQTNAQAEVPAAATPAWTATASASSTATTEISPSPAPANTATSTPAPGITETVPSASSTPEPVIALPEEHYISGIFSDKQYFSLGCEARAAVDWAGFFGVTINEYEFQYSLPISDNPDKGFVGDVNDPWGQAPPYSYGVHAAPVAALLQSYHLPAAGEKGLTIEQIKAELAADQPVIAWVIGNMTYSPPAEYTDQAGDATTVAAYEHVVLLTGYNTESIRYITNGKFYDVPTSVFEQSWGVLGNMALYYNDAQASE
jgi:uncharacterized protein YvpB